MKKEDKDLQLQIRCLTSTVYDLQKMRIAVGNRIVQSFYIQMGIEPGQKKDSAEADSMAMIQKLMKEYDKVTDLMVENNFSIKKQLNNLPKNVTLQYIKSDLDYKLIKQYASIYENEKDTVKILAKYVQQHPMWKKFFSTVPGCGELMAANCLSYLDIDVARHVSSFWKYCGLDAVTEKDENGNDIYTPVDSKKRKLRRKEYFVDKYGDKVSVGVKFSGEFDEAGEPIYTDREGNEYLIRVETKEVDGVPTPVYEDIETGEEYVGDAIPLKHGRGMGDTEMFDYVDANGEIKQKRGITYNPKLRTALLGVMSGCILKVGQRFGENKYERAYREYRDRLDNMPRHEGKSDGQKHKIAVRFMVKEFLRDLWVEWRTYEGYEISEPYEVAYLGRKPHKYNEAHVKRAAESKA